MLATFAHDQLGRRTSLTRGNGAVTGYQYDAVSRLSQLALNIGGSATTDDLTLGFTYNPAGQIASTTRSNDLYAWTGHGSGTTSTTANGRNQLASWVSTLVHDSKGNVTTDGTYTYTYSSENLLTSLANSASGAIQSSAAFTYDPLMRLAKIDSSNSALDADLGYDGREIVLEGLSSNRTRRYVFGPGVDEPLVAYLVTSTGTTRSWYLADERGSTVRQTNDAGAPAGGIGKYDEYGVGPGTSRFQYTGQYWLGDANLHYYRARVYDPKLGRFLQPDPIGYGDGMNLYAYVKGDPVNFADPSGLEVNDIFINGNCVLLCRQGPVWEHEDRTRGVGGGSGARASEGGGGGGSDQPEDEEPPSGNPAECGNDECTEVIISFKPCKITWCLSRWWRLGRESTEEHGRERDRLIIGVLPPPGPASRIRVTIGNRVILLPPRTPRTHTGKGDTSAEVRRLRAAQEAKEAAERAKSRGRILDALLDFFRVIGIGG